MAVRMRGGKFFVDVTVGDKRKTKTLPLGTTKAEADAVDAEFRAALLRGQEVDTVKADDSWTLGKAFERTTRLFWKSGKSAYTSINNGKLVVEFFGEDMLCSKIDVDAIDEMVEHFEDQGNENGTINRKVSALSKMLHVARDRGGLDKLPKITRKKEETRRIRWLTDAEEQELLSLFNAWGRVHHAEAATVLMDTGFRLSELWALHENDIDFASGLIHCWVNKGNHPRSVPMTSRVRTIMQRRLKRVGKNPFPYNNPWFRYQWTMARKAMRLADDKNFVPHMLRHTCASRLVQRGASIAVVQQWLGHSNVQMTMRYAHLAPGNLQDAMLLLEGNNGTTMGSREDGTDLSSSVPVRRVSVG